MKLLITGVAGFIGFSLCNKLLKNSKFDIYGIDNLNTHYDLGLKKKRLEILKKYGKKFKFFKIDISNQSSINNNFKKNKYQYVIHLAAQAGVRKSIEKPNLYMKSNVIGFNNIIQSVKEYNIKHFIFASSSSVYGKSKKFPIEECDITDNPVSYYAATKKMNEVAAYSFSEIYKIPTTGLRFFTVYGEYGRPDMAPFKFTERIFNDQYIELYNNGNLYRDFTYIDDITNSIIKLIKKIPSKNQNPPFRILNIGSGKSVKVSSFVQIIENELNKKAKVKNLPMQKGDVYKTHANINRLKKIIDIKKHTSVDEGLSKFVKWYKKFKKN